MLCDQCHATNDDDALFCTACGAARAGTPQNRQEKNRTWIYLLLLLPVIALAAGAGYYKFYLPNGVAAVVNGETISIAEVDDALGGSGASVMPADQWERMRLAALNNLIAERIAEQEAKQAGISVSQAEVDAAAVQMQPGGADRRKEAARRLLVRKFIDTRVLAGTEDPVAAGRKVNDWLRGAMGRASVRIALAEGLPASGGCGCCNVGTRAVPGVQQKKDARDEQLTPRVREAKAAALGYWKKRYGSEPEDLQVKDFGCHFQVDVIQNARIARSLRYQNGAISEM